MIGLIKILIPIIFIFDCSSQKISGIDECVVLKKYYPLGSCGTLALAAAYMFSLEKNDSTIVGIVRCPDTYGEDFFKEGDKYEVKLTNVGIFDSLKNYALTNPFEKNNYSTFLLSKIKRLQ